MFQLLVPIVLQLRFELQEDFFRGLAGAPDPQPKHSNAGTGVQHSAVPYSDDNQTVSSLGDSDIEGVTHPSIAGTPGASPQDMRGESGRNGSSGGTGGAPSASMALRAEGILAEVCRALGLDPWMEPSEERVAEAFERAPAHKQARALGIVFEAALATGGSFAESPQTKGLPTVQDGTLQAVPTTLAMPTPGADLNGDTVAEVLASTVGASGDAADSQDEDRDTDSTVVGREGTPRAALKRQERISLTGKARSQGALGKGAWSVAVCPYDYKRLIFEVCTLLKDVSASHALP